MTSDNALLAVAIIAVIVSGALLTLSYSNLFQLQSILLSPNETGNITLTISDNLNIQLTDNIIDWGSGTVNTAGGFNQANLSTVGSQGVDLGGTWAICATPGPSCTTDGFKVKNIGNIPAKLYLTTGKNATNFICNSTLGNCGTGASPIAPDANYTYNVSNIDAGVCTPPAGFNLNQFYSVNVTPPFATPFPTYQGTLVCDPFRIGDPNGVRVDISLAIPLDSRIPRTNKNDTMYFTATP